MVLYLITPGTEMLGRQPTHIRLKQYGNYAIGIDHAGCISNYSRKTTLSYPSLTFAAVAILSAFPHAKMV